MEELSTLSNMDLLNTLASQIKDGPYNESLTRFVFLIMESMHLVNQPHPYWEIDETVDTPTIVYDDDELIKKIVTSEKTDYVKLFEFIYRTFRGELNPNDDKKINQFPKVKIKYLENNK